MPFYKQFSYKNSEIIIWKYDEAENFDDLVLTDLDLKKIENYHPKKRAEFLMIRRILKEKLPDAKIFYEENGQPFLKDSEMEISVSHSFPLAGIAFSKAKIGFDIEKISTKMSRVKHKFLHGSEVNWLPQDFENEYLTAIWAMKEALYKLHPSKLWSLKKHYKISPFVLSENFTTEAEVFDENWKDQFELNVFREDAYFVAVVLAEGDFNFKNN